VETNGANLSEGDLLQVVTNGSTLAHEAGGSVHL
jgi:hypothetical protein